MKRLLILIVLFLPLVISREPLAQESPLIRVAIVNHAAAVRLKVGGAFAVIDSASKLELYRGENLNATVTANKSSVLLGGLKVNASRFIIKPNHMEAITVDGRRFREAIEFTRKGDGTMLLVNMVNLEDYIKGILYHEVSHYWPLEALKAQAVACRSYALYQIRQNRAKDFDVASDTSSQVYGGRTSERNRTTRAVEATRGLVLTYQGEVIPAYFHATCGGHTQDASLLWKTNLPCLKGVPCPLCKNSPRFNWHSVIELGELRQRLVNAGHSLGVIKIITALGKDASGRITDLRIVSSRNEVVISAKDFRAAAGSNEIRSTNFSVEITGGDAVFEGVGWGHGAGMCQWGAYFLAKDGKGFQEILSYYYPGSAISKI